MRSHVLPIFKTYTPMKSFNDLNVGVTLYFIYQKYFNNYLYIFLFRYIIVYV